MSNLNPWKIFQLINVMFLLKFPKLFLSRVYCAVPPQFECLVLALFFLKIPLHFDAVWRDCVSNLNPWKVSQLINVMFLLKFSEVFLSRVYRAVSPQFECVVLALFFLKIPLHSYAVWRDYVSNLNP